MKHYARKLTEEINDIISGEDRAVWASAIQSAVSRAMARPEAICAQYIEQAKAKRTGRESVVDGAIHFQIETVREIADRCSGSRIDEERQMHLYWSDALGKWITVSDESPSPDARA